MNLIIVESPTKAKTIARFLGKNFLVESSYGHIRDLPKSKLGIDINNNFQPHYIIPKKSQKIVSRLKKLSQKSNKVILATDEDREGEAIAWHLIKALGLEKTKEIERIVFHEITKKAIEKALKNPRFINNNLVESQQARRILDRLVGYELSPFLWKKLIRGLSAGRVQSVALRLIAERENEIRNFKPQDYWTIIAIFQKEEEKTIQWEGSLIKINDKPIPKPGITKKEETEKIIAELKKSSWKIISIDKKGKEVKSRPPFITSTLQQEAWQKLKFSAKKTMLIAQQLYEGIELEKERTGLITYMRTDSFSIAEEALVSGRKYIEKTFGEKYLPAQAKKYKTKSKSAQEAHESIRPTDPCRHPEKIKKYLNPDQYKLYDLIWRRFIASQMANALFENTIINIKAISNTGKIYLFQSKGSILKFDGFLKIYPIQIEEKILPLLTLKDKISAKEIKAQKHQTQPPARYTEASLIKTLEKFGIGRPSTYAPIISTIKERGYVSTDKTKHFIPTEIGEKVNEVLTTHFPEIVDINFTAKMEKNLDEIASGRKKRVPVLWEFYEPFKKKLLEKYQTVEKQSLIEETDEVCELCGKPMVIRQGKFGRFIACSGFPECKNTKNLPPKELNIKCPLCQGKIVERKTKKGRLFYGCSNWPKCKFASWQKPTGKLCPSCQSYLIEIKNKIKCSNKNCSYEE